MTFFWVWFAILVGGAAVLAVLFADGPERKHLVDAIERDLYATDIKRGLFGRVSFSVRRGRHLVELYVKRSPGWPEKKKRRDVWRIRIVNVDVASPFHFQIHRSGLITLLPSDQSLQKLKAGVAASGIHFDVRGVLDGHAIELLQDPGLLALLTALFKTGGRNHIRSLSFGTNACVEVKMRTDALDSKAWNSLIDALIEITDLVRQTSASFEAARTPVPRIQPRIADAATSPEPVVVPAPPHRSVGASSGAPVGFGSRSFDVDD